MANLASLQIAGDNALSTAEAAAKPTTVATGGIVTTNGPYTYHRYNSSSNFVMTDAGYVEMIIIGGGGGAKDDNGSGGGGGGFLFRADDLAAATYAITVGGGGTGHTSGNKGTDSTFGTIANGTAYGGGGGQNDGVNQQSHSPVGSTGGPGKGTNARSSQNNQEPVDGQGNAAGIPCNFDNSGAPGGGGAGSPGGDTTAINTSHAWAGNGGSGMFAGSAFANFGVNGFFSGGGGGGGGQDSSGNGGYGGSGGGGDGAWDTGAGEGGVGHSGGAGGGAGQGGIGAAGGSGVIIVRYLTP